MDKRTEWIEKHQPYELDYHKSVDFHFTDEFDRYWQNIFEWIGEIKGEKLDIGCGPRSPIIGKKTCIEPLADKYREFGKKEWWDKVYSQPAEEFIPELEGKFDFILCWNCLDHTYDWKQILDNIKRYLKKDGIIALATDFKYPMIGHPGFKKEEFEGKMKEFKIIKRTDNFSERDTAILCTLR